MNGRKPAILIVEDDEDMAKLNARLLTRQGYEARIASNAAQARERAGEGMPDLFVLDIGLPDGNGLSLCKEIRETSDAPIVFLTGITGSGDKVSGLDAGCDYYLTKPYDKDEFVAVVQNLLRRAEREREKLAGTTVIRHGSLMLRVDERKAFVDGRDAQLTAKEFAILQLLMSNEGKEVTYEEFYSAIWDAPMIKDSSALRKQMSRIKKKLDEENSKDFSIYTEHGRGYTFIATGK